MKARVAQRHHAGFCLLAYAARGMPRGSIGAPPERGAGAVSYTHLPTAGDRSWVRWRRKTPWRGLAGDEGMATAGL